MSSHFVRPDVRAFLDYLAAANSPTIRELGHIEARKVTLAMRDLADAPLGELAVMRDFSIPGPHGGEIGLRLFDARETRGPGPALVFFHGGGFVVGSIESYAPLCAEIARLLDLPVISVEYRLSPEHPWPAAPDDCEAAARWVATSPAELGREVTGLVLAGDSAGGTLTIVTALALRDHPAAAPVIAQWPIYPATDLGGRYPSYDHFGDGYFLTHDGMLWFNECYQPDFLHWRASPMRRDQHGMPPTLLLTASLDPLVDQGRSYASALIAAGVPTVYREAAGNIHGFLSLRKAIPSSAYDLRGALTALRAMIEERVTA
jgi:acetyl esterase